MKNEQPGPCGSGVGDESPRPDVVIIDLNPHVVECVGCGADCLRAQGVPMREGEFLAVDDPGEWGGFDACPACYRAYEEGGPAALNARLRALKESSHV